MNENEIKLGIGLLPNKEINDFLIEITNILKKKYKFSYNLDGTSYIPHLTLFQSKFNSYESVRSSLISLILASSIQNGQPPEIKFNEIDIFAETFIFYDCTKTDRLQSFHERTIDSVIKYLVTNAVPIGKEQNLIGLTDKEVRSLSKFGYPFAMEAFRPHFTIGRVLENKPNIIEIKGLLGKITDLFKGYSFRPKELVIYDLGIDGSCIGIKDRFYLD